MHKIFSSFPFEIYNDTNNLFTVYTPIDSHFSHLLTQFFKQISNFRPPPHKKKIDERKKWLNIDCKIIVIFSLLLLFFFFFKNL